jgi:hypothetical protein
MIPSLGSKFKKDLKNTLSTFDTNSNSITTNIYMDKLSESRSLSPGVRKSYEPEKSTTPKNISYFKEVFLDILIKYFKNNVVLINNLVELSDKIIMKKDDLEYLICILLEIDSKNIDIEVEEIQTKTCCGKICSKLPRYRKIDDMIIDKKKSFEINHNQYYIQMSTEFNISLDYIMV